MLDARPFGSRRDDDGRPPGAPPTEAERLRTVGIVVAAVALLVGGVVLGWWLMFTALLSELGPLTPVAVLVVLGAGAWFGRRRWVTFAPAMGTLVGAVAALVAVLLLAWALEGF